MTEQELSLEADHLLNLAQLIQAAIDSSEMDVLNDLLTQYEQITARIKQFARINKAAVLACEKLRSVMSREAELLAHASKARDALFEELQTARQTLAINSAYNE